MSDQEFKINLTLKDEKEIPQEIKYLDNLKEIKEKYLRETNVDPLDYYRFQMQIGFIIENTLYYQTISENYIVIYLLQFFQKLQQSYNKEKIDFQLMISLVYSPKEMQENAMTELNHFLMKEIFYDQKYQLIQPKQKTYKKLIQNIVGYQKKGREDNKFAFNVFNLLKLQRNSYSKYFSVKILESDLLVLKYKEQKVILKISSQKLVFKSFNIMIKLFKIEAAALIDIEFEDNIMRVSFMYNESRH